MATFTGTGSHNSNYTGTLTVTESSYSVANNTSEVAYSLVLTGNNGYYFQQWYLTTKVTINGTEVQNRYEQISMPSPSGGVSTYAVCSGTLTVPHNNDGTKTISVSASMSTPTSQSFLPGTINMSGSLALTTIPRASTLSIDYPGYLIVNSQGSMTITSASSSFTHTITYSGLELSGTVANTAAGVSSVSWTPPSTFYAKMPNTDTATITLTLKTYSGGTEIGSNSYSVSLRIGYWIVPTTPTVTLSPVNTNAWINSKSLYVGGYTKLRAQVSANPGTGATMSYSTLSGAITSPGWDVTSSNALGVGTQSVTATVVDSRNRSASNTASVTFLSYSPPAITTFKAERGIYSGGSWTSNVSGDHIRVQAAGSVSLSSYGNTGTISVTIGGTSPSASSGNYYYFTNTNATTSYAVAGSITDSVGNTTSRGLTVPTVSVPFNVDVDLPGAAFGMIAQKSEVLEVAQDWSLVVNGYGNEMKVMPYSWNTTGGNTSAGYARVATITITGVYVGGPFIFEVRRELDAGATRLILNFNEQNTTDPTVGEFYYDSLPITSGTAFSAFVLRTGPGAWDVYVCKTTGGASIDVVSYVPAHVQGRVNITYSDAFFSTVQSGATSATSLSVYSPVTKASGISALDGWAARSGNVASFYAVVTNGSAAKSGGTDVIATGLPIPAFGAIQATGAVYTNQGAFSSIVRIRINLNGELQLWYGGNLPANYILVVQITYIT